MTWHRLVESKVCADCKCFPCLCEGPEARPCACGGVVIARSSDPTYGVREHQQEPKHKAWAEAVYG